VRDNLARTHMSTVDREPAARTREWPRASWRTALGLVSASLLASAAQVGGVADAAPSSGAPYIVTVSEGVDPLVLAAAVRVQPSFVYDSAMNGFAADLTDVQRRKLLADVRVVDVTDDRVLQADAVENAEVPPGHPAQFTSWGQDRIGLLTSPSANVDGVDERIDADVAVIDSGIANHPDLNVAGGVDCTRGKNAGYGDTDGHGTLAAGFIGALDNSFGAVGIAPGVRVWAVRVQSKSKVITDSSVICGLEWVRDHADTIEVANLSLGDNRDWPGNCGQKRKGIRPDPTHASVCEVVAAGVTLVASAGNEAIDAGRHIPSAYPEVIAVSAFTETDGLPGGHGPPANCLPGEYDDHLATFSNFGSTIEFAAPGVCVTSTYLNNAYARVSGTSFSAPHTAGAAALVMAADPDATPQQVRDTLHEAAERAPLLGDPDNHPEPILNVAGL
jgi:subtilisin